MARKKSSTASAKSQISSATRQGKSLTREGARLIREQQRALAKAQSAALREFRRDYAALKRAGLVKGDARSVKATAHNKKLVRRFENVITKSDRTFKVKRRDVEKLRSEGVEIRNGRAIVRADLHVRNGQVFKRRIGSGDKKFGGGKIIHLKGDTLENALKDAWNKLKPKYGMALSFNGSSSFVMYQSLELMLALVAANHFKYMVDAVDGDLSKISAFAPNMQPETYHENRRAESNALALARAERRKAKDRDRYQRKIQEQLARDPSRLEYRKPIKRTGRGH